MLVPPLIIIIYSLITNQMYRGSKENLRVQLTMSQIVLNIVTCEIKGIFSDSNIFLWHESEDVNKKCLFPKFQLIPILRFPVMHDYVYFTAPIDYCVDMNSLVSETFLWKLLSFHTEMISTQLLWGSVLLRGVHPKYAKNSYFKNFESALYLTSVSMPLRQFVVHYNKTGNKSHGPILKYGQLKLAQGWKMTVNFEILVFDIP